MSGHHLAPALLAACAVVGLAARASQQNPSSQTVFRAGTFIVPVDVRVLDADFKPILGLTRADFTILEDGVPQEIRHFSATTLTPDPSAPPVQRATPAAEPRSQNRRVFLVVLGRGRLQPPSRGVDAALRFVREQLLPQDQIALFAFNRATDFTADRGYIVGVLERFKASHESIEAKIKQRSFEDVLTVYGATIPGSVQGEIDALFRVPGGPALRTPTAANVATEDRIRADERDAREAAVSQAILRDRAALGGFAIPGQAEIGSLSQSQIVSSGFADFLADFPRGMQDLTKLYQGIEYLRHLDGEKHLVYVTERGMSLPRLEDHTSVAAMANDARVVVDTIQTGGLPTRGVNDPAPFQETFNIHSLRTVSELTGGLSSIYSPANRAMDRLVSATSSSYLLGYTPADSNFNGKYRRISVSVSRRGARAYWRHGYFARNPLLPFDHRMALTYNRIASATTATMEIGDIKFNLSADEVRDGAGLGLKVDLQIDPSRLAWSGNGTDRTAAIDIAMFAIDRNQEMAGEHWQHVPLRLSPELLERAGKTGLTYSVRIPLKTEITAVKVVVYNFDSDLLGTGSRRLR